MAHAEPLFKALGAAKHLDKRYVLSGQSPNRRKHLQFSIRGLFVICFSVAVGLGAAKSAPLPWSTGLFATAAFWCMCGLMTQAVDLRNALRTSADAAADVRCGWRTGVFWRLGLLLLFLTYFVVQYMVQNGSLPLSRSGRVGGHLLWQDIFGALLYLLFVMLLASVPGLVRSTSPTGLASRCIAFLGFFAVVVCCLLMWSNGLSIYYLVYVATTSYEQFAPNVCAIEGIDANIIARGHRFFLLCLLATCLALVSFACIRQVASPRSRQRVYRVMILAMLALAMAGSASLAVWITTGGLWRLSPAWASAETMSPMLRWFCIFLLSGLLTTAITYRLLRQGMGPVDADEPAWRRHEGAYYHEHRGVMTMLIVASLVFLFEKQQEIPVWRAVADCFFQLFRSPEDYRFIANLFLDASRSLVIVLFQNPGNCLVVAILWLAIRGLFIGRTWTWRHAPVPVATMRLPCARFVVVWLALFVTLAAAGIAFAWLSFAVWLTPWAAF
jgi:hypothetical protein